MNIDQGNEGQDCYRGLLFLIPTRNRPELAIGAIKSVLKCDRSDIRVVVSDNSTDEKRRDQLAHYCKNSKDSRLSYICPDRPMSMSSHWEWFISKILLEESINHFHCLTDRFLLRTGAVVEMANLASEFSHLPICFNEDIVFDDNLPVKVLQMPWSGKLFEIESEVLLDMAANKCEGLWRFPVPRCGMNGIIPRALFLSVKKYFGSICKDTIAPDYGFAFRALSVTKSLIYFDKSLKINRGLSVSNGHSLVQGVLNDASKDFVSNTGGSSIYHSCCPIPELQTGISTIFHEYFSAKERSLDLVYPNISIEKYFEMEIDAVSAMKEGSLKLKMTRILAENGIDSSQQKAKVSNKSFYRFLRVSTYVNFFWRFIGREELRDFWLLLNKKFNIHPPDLNSFVFSSIEDAWDYLGKFPRRRRQYRGYIVDFLTTYQHGWHEIEANHNLYQACLPFFVPKEDDN